MSTETNELAEGIRQTGRTLEAVSASMRAAKIELDRRQSMIEHYQRKNADHERLVTKLFELLGNDQFDEAHDLVRDAFFGIHGPSDEQ